MEDHNLHMDESRTRQHDPARYEWSQSESASTFTGEAQQNLPGALLGDSRLSGRGNDPVRAAVMQQAQQTHGNRAVQRCLQRTTSNSTPSATAKPVQRVAVQREDKPEWELPIGDDSKWSLSPSESQFQFGGKRRNWGFGYGFGENDIFTRLGGSTEGGLDWGAKMGYSPLSTELSGSVNVGQWEGRAGYNFGEGEGSGGLTYSPRNFPPINLDVSGSREGKFGASLGFGNPYIPMPDLFNAGINGGPLEGPMDNARSANSPGGALQAGGGFIPALNDFGGENRWGAGAFLNRGGPGNWFGGLYGQVRF